jgi:hypothetical protein
MTIQMRRGFGWGHIRREARRKVVLQRSEELNPTALKAVNAISSQISPKQGAPTQAALQCDQEVQRRIGLI